MRRHGKPHALRGWKRSASVRGRSLVVDNRRRVFEVTAVLPGPTLALRRLVVDSAGRVMFGQYDGELMHRTVRDGMLLDDAWRVSQGA
jgi:hypothetical protein